jgi:hypothetical protein
VPSQIEANPPTMRMCAFHDNFDLYAIFIPQPVTWTCSPGQFAPKTGSFQGDFEGCPLTCAVGHYGLNTNETSPDCAGPCPVSESFRSLVLAAAMLTLANALLPAHSPDTTAPRAQRFPIPAPPALRIRSRVAQGLRAAFRAIPAHTAMPLPTPTRAARRAPLALSQRPSCRQRAVHALSAATAPRREPCRPWSGSPALPARTAPRPACSMPPSARCVRQVARTPAEAPCRQRIAASALRADTRMSLEQPSAPPAHPASTSRRQMRPRASRARSATIARRVAAAPFLARQAPT